LHIIACTVIAAVTIIVASALLAFVTPPLVTGIVLGVIAFVAADYLLYQNSCSKQAQIETLQQLMVAQCALNDANNKLAAACSNLLGM
jgi:hypothetical protein